MNRLRSKDGNNYTGKHLYGRHAAALSRKTDNGNFGLELGGYVDPM
jgi:hypothetical protein